MPTGLRIEVEGVSGLARALRKAGDEGSRDFLLQANKEAAASVETAARPAIPVRSGRLVGSLRSSGSAKGGVVLLGKARVPYAGPLHFGWFAARTWGRTIARRPIKPGLWLYDALDRRRGEVEDIYYRRLDELLAIVTKEAAT
ncbi:MAG: HK97 gp10 family phage protein [Acidimicrobiales bacterium]|nr:HK97 gp10 family phage protein [Acidimicrobiales bacterium]